MNERYNQMIDDCYWNHLQHIRKESIQPLLDSGWCVEPNYPTKEEFINKIKIDEKFAKKWGVKITERELGFRERQNYGIDILGYESLLDYGHSQNDDDIILELLNEWNVPTKIITLDYNGEIVEYYE
jgi:hypothetical protein